MSIEKQTEAPRLSDVSVLNPSEYTIGASSANFSHISDQALRSMDVDANDAEQGDIKRPDGTVISSPVGLIDEVEADPETIRQSHETAAVERIGKMEDHVQKEHLAWLSTHLGDCLTDLKTDEKAGAWFKAYSQSRGHELNELAKTQGYPAVAESLNKALESSGSPYKVSIVKAPPEYNLHGPMTSTTHKMNLLNPEGKTIGSLGMGRPEEKAKKDLRM